MATVRLGMQPLILQLREMTQAGTEEYTISGQDFFSDEQLQDVLDRFRLDIYQEIVRPVPQFIDGATVYRDYFFNAENVEQATSGSAVWQMRTENGAAVGTADYTIEYYARRIRFNTATDGSEYNLDYRSYDMYRAAAYIWRLKAANVASRYDVRTDNHDLKRSQLRASFEKMAEHYDDLAAKQGSGFSRGGRMKTMYRSDTYG